MSARSLGVARASSARVIAMLVSSTLVMSFATTAGADGRTTSSPDASLTVTSKPPPKVAKRRVMNVALTLGSAGLAAASSTILKSRLVPDDCRWCNPPGIDSGIRNALVWHNTDRAGMLSSLTAHAAIPALTLGLVTLGSLSSSGTKNLFDDLLPIVETVAVSQLVVQGFKLGVGRERPYAHYGEGIDSDDNLSFVSGHSALAFGLVTSAGIIAHERGYKVEPYIWAIGLPLAATTAYLRIAADKHYFTDVVAGSLIGVAAGILIPKLSKRLPFEIAPSANGVTIVGQF